MKRILLPCLVFMLVMLTGCLGKQVPYQEVAPEAGKASVYVYRPTSVVNSAETMILEINGEEIGLLSHSFYLHSFVEPGKAKLVVKKNVWPYTEYGSIALDDVQAGKTYFIKCDPILMAGFDMVLMDEDQGRAEAKETKLFINE